jgi:hypothetical protein
VEEVQASRWVRRNEERWSKAVQHAVELLASLSLRLSTRNKMGGKAGRRMEGELRISKRRGDLTHAS